MNTTWRELAVRAALLICAVTIAPPIARFAVLEWRYLSWNDSYDDVNFVAWHEGLIDYEGDASLASRGDRAALRRILSVSEYTDGGSGFSHASHLFEILRPWHRDEVMGIVESFAGELRWRARSYVVWVFDQYEKGGTGP